jgi:hypothetical protein
MPNEKITAYKTGARVRTEAIATPSGERYYISEKTKEGILLTELTANGATTNQIYRKTDSDPETVLAEYVCTGREFAVEQREKYTPVRINAACEACGESALQRELDTLNIEDMRDVPALPMLLCTSCNAKSYFITKEYIRNISDSNIGMFTEEELSLRERDKEAFINAIWEHVIRIFASKKINRIKLEG